MKIESGKTYRSEHNERRFVDAVKDDTVRYIFPLSGRTGTVPLAEFVTWVVGEYVPPEAP